MKAIRMMYIVGIYIFGAPIILASIAAFTVWSLIDWRLDFGDWEGASSIFGAIREGFIAGMKFNWHWAKTGELDFDYLMF